MNTSAKPARFYNVLILEKGKPIAERLKPAFGALRAAISNVLTAAQKAWIAAHRPDGPPPRP